MLTKTFFNRAPLTGNQLAMLPAGSIRAEGKLREQLITLRAGLLSSVSSLIPAAGPGSCFYGGTLPADPAAARVLEAMLWTSALLADRELERSALSLARQVMEHQREDGSFGDGASFLACSAMLRAISAAYSVTGEKAFLSFIIRYFKYLHTALRENPLSGEDAMHTADTLASGILVYNITGQKAVLSVLEMLIAQGTDYTSLFHTFPYRLPVSAQIAEDDLKADGEKGDYIARLMQMGNGANLAEGLRASALTGVITGSAKHTGAPERGLARINRAHKAVSGSITADPLLGGQSPTRGVSVAAAAEMEASFETLFTCPDGVQFADQWEQIFYNVIQSAFSRDLLAVQSIQQVNQLALLAGIRFPFSKPDAALYSLGDPEALSAILPVLPRFLMHQWMLTRDEGICAMGYAPCQVHYPLKDVQLRITVESDYPLSGNVRITLNMNRDIAFPLRLRIPAWSSRATALIQGETFEAGKTPFLVLSRQWHDGDVIMLNLPMNPRLESGYHQAVSVHRGPLLFSLALETEADSETLITDYARAIVAEEPIKVCVNEDNTRVHLEVGTVSAGIWQSSDGIADPPPMDIPEARPEDVQVLCLVPYADTVLRISVFPSYSFVR